MLGKVVCCLVRFVKPASTRESPFPNPNNLSRVKSERLLSVPTRALKSTTRHLITRPQTELLTAPGDNRRETDFETRNGRWVLKHTSYSPNGQRPSQQFTRERFSHDGFVAVAVSDHSKKGAAYQVLRSMEHDYVTRQQKRRGTFIVNET